MEGSHDVVNKAVCVGGGGVAFDHQGVEAVDACLNEQVGNGEDGVLQTRGASTVSAGGELVTVQSDAFRPDTVGILRPDKSNEDQDGRQVLRQDTGQCDAVGAHAADDDEEEFRMTFRMPAMSR